MAFLHPTCENISMKKKDVEQTLHLVNVEKGLPRFCGTFVILNVHKLVVCQVEANDGHGFLDAISYSFNTLGSTLEGAFLDLSIMFERSMEAKTISILNFQRQNISIEFVYDSSSFILAQTMGLYNKILQIKLWCT